MSRETPTKAPKTALFTFAAPNRDALDALGRYAKASIEVAERAGATPSFRGSVAYQPIGDCPAGIVGVAEFRSPDAVEALFERDPAYLKLIPDRDQAFIRLNVFTAQVGAEQRWPDSGTLLLSFGVPNPDAADAAGAYAEGSAPLLKQHGAEPVGRFVVDKQIMGSDPASFVGVTRFASERDATEMFTSEAYRALVADRDRAFTSLNAYLINL